MTEQEIAEALGFILYNYCYHNHSGALPLSTAELELISGSGEDHSIGRKTYCTCLLWAKDNPEFDFSSVLLSKRRELTNEKTYQHLMAMLKQIEDEGILDEFRNDMLKSKLE